MNGLQEKKSETSTATRRPTKSSQRKRSEVCVRKTLTMTMKSTIAKLLKPARIRHHEFERKVLIPPSLSMGGDNGPKTTSDPYRTGKNFDVGYPVGGRLPYESSS